MKIKELRTCLQLSQAAFAKPIGLSPTHIARFEKGKSVPKDEIIENICSVFGVKRRFCGFCNLKLIAYDGIEIGQSNRKEWDFILSFFSKRIYYNELYDIIISLV